MEQIGLIVKKLDNNEALVEFRRHKLCDKCGQCSGPNQHLERVKNPYNFQENEWVFVAIKSKNVLTAAFLVYIFPVLSLLAAYLIARHFSQQEGWAVFFGLSAMALSFLLIRWQDKYFAQQKDYMPLIQRKANQGQVSDYR